MTGRAVETIVWSRAACKRGREEMKEAGKREESRREIERNIRRERSKWEKVGSLSRTQSPTSKVLPALSLSHSSPSRSSPLSHSTKIHPKHFYSPRIRRAWDQEGRSTCYSSIVTKWGSSSVSTRGIRTWISSYSLSMRYKLTLGITCSLSVFSQCSFFSPFASSGAVAWSDGEEDFSRSPVGEVGLDSSTASTSFALELIF